MCRSLWVKELVTVEVQRPRLRVEELQVANAPLASDFLSISLTQSTYPESWVGRRQNRTNSCFPAPYVDWDTVQNSGNLE